MRSAAWRPQEITALPAIGAGGPHSPVPRHPEKEMPYATTHRADHRRGLVEAVYAAAPEAVEVIVIDRDVAEMGERLVAEPQPIQALNELDADLTELLLAQEWPEQIDPSG